MKLKKKIGKIFTSKFVGTGPSSYEKIIYRAAVSQRLRNIALKMLMTTREITGSSLGTNRLIDGYLNSVQEVCFHTLSS